MRNPLKLDRAKQVRGTQLLPAFGAPRGRNGLKPLGPLAIPFHIRSIIKNLIEQVGHSAI